MLVLMYSRSCCRYGCWQRFHRFRRELVAGWDVLDATLEVRRCGTADQCTCTTSTHTCTSTYVHPARSLAPSPVRAMLVLCARSYLYYPPHHRMTGETSVHSRACPRRSACATNTQATRNRSDKHRENTGMSNNTCQLPHACTWSQSLPAHMLFLSLSHYPYPNNASM